MITINQYFTLMLAGLNNFTHILINKQLDGFRIDKQLKVTWFILNLVELWLQEPMIILGGLQFFHKILLGLWHQLGWNQHLNHFHLHHHIQKYLQSQHQHHIQRYHQSQHHHHIEKWKKSISFAMRITHNEFFEFISLRLFLVFSCIIISKCFFVYESASHML